MTHAITKKTEGKKARLLELDILRGLVMILMALDHAGVFLMRELHLASEAWDIPMITHSSFFAFLTRNVSHLAAPGFTFLMGIGMALFTASRMQNGWPRLRIARFFAIRGLLIIVVEQIIVNPAWLLQYVPKTSTWSLSETAQASGTSDISGVFLGFSILFCLGAAMLVWGLFIHLDWKYIAAISGFSVLSSSLFVPSIELANSYYSPWYRILVLGGIEAPVSVNFPVLPWFGIIGLGILFGRLLLKDRKLAYRVLSIAGVLALIVFALLRTIGGFGNIHLASDDSWQSFFALTKYPPSLVYILLYLGLNALVLAGIAAIVDKKLSKVFSILGDLGKSALFFYVSHLYVYGILAMLILVIYPINRTLIFVYPLWLVGLAILYFLSQRYYKFKKQTALNSIWRFF